MVSVCLAAYNGDKFIHEQISSILPQLADNDELIISDDGSKDETISIIESFRDARIKLFRNELNKGVIGNFENALTKAKGEYIFLADQDDVWLTAKVAFCMEKLQDCSLVVSNCYVVNDKLEIVHDSYFELLHSGSGVVKNLRKNTYQGCCMCFKREVMNLVLPFPAHIPMHDAWIGFVADIFFTVKFEHTRLSLYRRHDNTTTNNKVGESTASVIRKIKNRTNLIFQVPNLIIRRYF